ncbi:hypothetical protein B296_00039824 [Ensete ventricosum]|uniref:Methyltransferase n=1 Tax=Ensete ventricosum TaxID=4639 RepID=A0A426ZS13_ENSVE|nr:hypothetical protein B296_00039824 [Ensete ventricosum]
MEVSTGKSHMITMRTVMYGQRLIRERRAGRWTDGDCPHQTYMRDVAVMGTGETRRGSREDDERRRGLSRAPWLREILFFCCFFGSAYTMAPKINHGEGRTRSSLSLIVVISLCCFFYVLGAWQRSGFGKGDNIALQITKQTECTDMPNLNFDTHHSGLGSLSNLGDSETKTFEPCDDRYTDYTPCQDQNRAMAYPRDNMIYRERHCPPDEEKLYCLIPAPKGYVAPFPWPKSRDYVPYANVPYKSLTVEKAVQNWVHYEGNVFRFPGGGTQFPQGADKYIDQLASVIPIDNGTVRTALDTGYGVYMMEVDRVLRPGGYWVLSGPPINWKVNYQVWKRTKEDIEEEQRKIEEIAELLCWEKIYEKAEFAIWRKRINAESCTQRQDEIGVNICETTNSDDVWYKKMEPCINQYPEVGNPKEFAGGELKPFPQRLNAVPPRISSGSVPGFSVKSYHEDNRLWQKHVKTYKKINDLLDTGRYRNIMDMNAHLGSFAAAIESPKLWVMNVVPTIAEISTLGVIYERGLIGIYHD